MSIVSLATVKSYCGISDSDYTSYGSTIHDAVEAFIKWYTGLDFVATTYTNEQHDGEGKSDLYLKHRPINYISRVAISKSSGIKVKNSATDATSIQVRVNSTSCIMIVDGGAYEHTDTLTLASYTTLTLLVAAINALSAYGWSAEVYDGDFSSIKPTILLPQVIDCSNWDGATKDWNYLQIAGQNVEVDIYESVGRIHRDGGFGFGNKNVTVTYNAEETPAYITQDILTAIGIINDARSKNNLDVTRWKVGEIEMTYGEVRQYLPQSIMEHLDRILLEGMRI